MATALYLRDSIQVLPSTGCSDYETIEVGSGQATKLRGFAASRLPFSWPVWLSGILPESVKVPGFYYPFELEIATLKADAVDLLQPIPVTVNMVGNITYVSDNLFYCWGSGNTLLEARADYAANLIEEYQDLLTERNLLSRFAANRLKKLEQYIAKR